MSKRTERRSTVIHYIEEQRKAGQLDVEIRRDLVAEGWPMDVIKHAMGELKKHHPDHKKPTPEKQKYTPLQIGLIGLGAFIILALIAVFI